MPNIDVLTMENFARNQNWAKVFSTLNENLQKFNNFVTYILDATLTKAQSWTATGGAQTFQTTESFTLGTRKLFVFVDGQKLNLREHYYEVSPNKFRIIDPNILSAGTKVLALITEQYKVPEYSTVLALEHFTATANQSMFSLTNEFVPGRNMVEVYVEGARQWITTGFTEALDGRSITLTEGVPVGTEVLIVLNYIPGTIAIERFTATANQELFTLANNTYEVGSDTLEVFRDGVHQWTTSGYTETSSSSFTVVGACDAGTDIVAVITKSGTRHVEKFIATAGQTLFNLTNSYERGVNLLEVYVDNVRQWPGTNGGFTETSDTSFTLSAACTAGTEVVAIVKT